MRVKKFGSPVVSYEEKAETFLRENPGLDIRHIAISLNQSSDWALTVVFYQEKEESGEGSVLLQEQG